MIVFKYSAKMEAGSKQLGNMDLVMVNSISHGMFLCVKRVIEYFFSDNNNHRIQVFSSDGKFFFQFGSKGSENGQLRFPSGLELSNCGQYLFVCYRCNHRIQMC